MQKKIRTILLLLIVFMVAGAGLHADCKPFPVTPAWTAKIEKLAPSKPMVKPKKKHKVLLFSTMTGYKHWVTPHTKEVVKILGQKSGAFDVVASDDVAMFEPSNIKQFDVIVLNNNCSAREHRNLFIDITKDPEKAASLEQSLLNHIAAGNGLVVLHGAITTLNNSERFSEMVGGSFDFHPKQQEVTGELVEPNHPMVKCFKGKPLVHLDEPYLFKGAYSKKAFRPLLKMDTARLDCGEKTDAVRSDERYIAWIKKHGRGRVFFCSPSHCAESFENPALLKFILNGIQYALGDLKCDDTPL